MKLTKKQIRFILRGQAPEKKYFGKVVKTHGKTGTKTYNTWSGIIQRCTNPNASGYERYGGKGITVCARWLVFENFLSDMGECPEGMEIDRIINEKGYEPLNCRWTTKSENMKNTHRGNFNEVIKSLTEEQLYNALTLIKGELKIDKK